QCSAHFPECILPLRYLRPNKLRCSRVQLSRHSLWSLPNWQKLLRKTSSSFVPPTLFKSHFPNLCPAPAGTLQPSARISWKAEPGNRIMLVSTPKTLLVVLCTTQDVVWYICNTYILQAFRVYPLLAAR